MIYPRFPKIYFINCIGCNNGGSKRYFLSLLEQPMSPVVHYIFIIPRTISAVEIIKILQDRDIAYTLIPLNHSIFGNLLRIPLEFLFAFLPLLFRTVKYISLSNYALSFLPSSFLLVHNAFIASPGFFSKSRRSFLLPIKKAFLSIYARSGSTFIVQTNHMQKLLSKTLKNKYCIQPKVAICSNPMPRPQYNILPKRLFPKQLLFPSTLHHHKQVSIASDALDSLMYIYPDLGLILTTDSPAKVSPNCIYTGQLSYKELQSFYRGSDILVFCSTIESLGLPLLEAMAYGLAIIAPDLPYAKELLGDASPYFINGSVESLKYAISRVLMDLPYWQSKSLSQFEYLGSLNSHTPSIWDIIDS